MTLKQLLEGVFLYVEVFEFLLRKRGFIKVWYEVCPFMWLLFIILLALPEFILTVLWVFACCRRFTLNFFQQIWILELCEGFLTFKLITLKLIMVFTTPGERIILELLQMQDHGVKQCISSIFVHTNHLEVLLNYRFWFSRSELEPKISAMFNSQVTLVGVCRPYFE